ncbi:pyridoxamine 5'-phosphate oxidase family protein [Chamaesiphon sp.]|uniref:pyridoxamine 5'-phosphate oxidase family protein n=1 Tax=Chamaesiphon sp. TaxID=2814140 RepID=UPI003593E0BD
MLNIDEMSLKDIRKLLHQVGYGHLAFIYEGKPCAMPMYYYLEDSDIYLFTTEGIKTYGMDANPEICLQVEEVHNSSHWQSVMVKGRAERLTDRHYHQAWWIEILTAQPKLTIEHDPLAVAERLP